MPHHRPALDPGGRGAAEGPPPVLAASAPGKELDGAVERELRAVRPTHVISVIGRPTGPRAMGRRIAFGGGVGSGRSRGFGRHTLGRLGGLLACLVCWSVWVVGTSIIPQAGANDSAIGDIRVGRSVGRVSVGLAVGPSSLGSLGFPARGGARDTRGRDQHD